MNLAGEPGHSFHDAPPPEEPLSKAQRLAYHEAALYLWRMFHFGKFSIGEMDYAMEHVYRLMQTGCLPKVPIHWRDHREDWTDGTS